MLDRYIPVKPKYYFLIEYQALNSDSIPIFMLTQPYNFRDLKELSSDDKSFEFYDNYILPGFGLKSKDTSRSSLSINLAPGMMGYKDEKYSEISKAIILDGTIKLWDLNLVNRIKLDRSVKYDPEFHGDSQEWLMGYLENSYMTINLPHNVELFAGRIGHNFGIPNDYGLILSNNPYNFDHFGFKTYGKSLQYSFYFTRLNDMSGKDSQGRVIPIGETRNCHRYWSIQRLDWSITNNFQVALSEATIYGGPQQDFVAAYLNPVNFFYASQRNQGYQMSGLWDISMFYRPFKSLGLYLDLFADDLIVNNEPVDNAGTMPREVYPDRLGISSKLSYTDLISDFSLTTLRYVRIWNDTYTTYRNFENYLFFNKSMGFPYNSYESLKFTFTKFMLPASMLNLEIESWRHGERKIADIFSGKKTKFPAGDVIYGTDISFSMRHLLFQNIDMEFDYSISFQSPSFKKTFKDPQINNLFNIKIYYHFMESL